MGEPRGARELTRVGPRLALAAALLLAAGAAAQPPCIGDCDGDARVDIADLTEGVRAILSPGPPTCTAWDPDADARVLVTDLVRGVALALGGACDPPPPSLAPILALIRPGWEIACQPLGPPLLAYAVATAGEVSLHCEVSPGHSNRTVLRRYRRGDAPAAFTYFSSADGFTDAVLRDLPARYVEVPFQHGFLNGAQRTLVWGLDCFVVTVWSFDDTNYRFAPDVYALSETILDAAEPAMRAACDEL